MSEKANQTQDDVWIHKQEGHIHYFVHRPTRRCGIHIRGLAELCGVHHTTIMGILKNAQKGEVSLVGLRESDINNILKNRDIFLVDLVGPS